ncbi:MAG: hypothetical protein OXH84_00270 [Gammaproteobacteria bacterium]|nr:hypothetical protein [Gammaproteobacteria bacterium]
MNKVDLIQILICENEDGTSGIHLTTTTRKHDGSFNLNMPTKGDQLVKQLRSLVDQLEHELIDDNNIKNTTNSNP